MAPRLSLAIIKLHVSLSWQVPGSHMQLNLKKSHKILFIMTREQLQSICVDNTATSFLGEQLVAQWPSFLKKKKKSASALKFQQETAASSSSHVTYFMVLNFAVGVEKQKWKKIDTTWIGASEQRVMGEHKTQHLLRVKGTQSVGIRNLNMSTISDAWREDNAQQRVCSVVAQSDHGFWYNFIRMKCVGEWTQMKRLWLWKIRNDMTDSLEMRDKSWLEYFPHGHRHGCQKRHLPLACRGEVTLVSLFSKGDNTPE